MLQVCEFLGIQLQKESETYRAECPICKEGGKRAFQIFPATNTYYCWSEKKSGDIIGLVARHGKMDEAAAGRKLAEHFDIKGTKKPETSGRFDAEEWGKTLDPNHPVLAPLGISPETYKAFGAGFNATKPSLKGLLCIPLRTGGGGKIQAFIGVHPETQEVTFPKSIELHLPLNLDRINKDLPIHVVFHPLDVLRNIDSGIPELMNTIAVLTTLTPEMLGHLAQYLHGAPSVEFHN